MKKVAFILLNIILSLCIAEAMSIGMIWDPKIHNDFLRNRVDKEIYLGINTNINALDNWCPNNERQILDHKVGLFLGKIIFSKNKQGILAPKFIPSNIANIANEADKINPLWLDEINKKYVPPQAQYDEMVGNYTELNANNVKTLCKNSKANITLTKEQIISYFTQLHKENTEFIANYIESINKNNGINAYYLHDKIYDDLLSKGILQKDMFKWWSNAPKTPYTNAMLLTLDFLAKTNQPNHKILLYDELFYAYLVWSLRNYTIRYYQGYLAEKNNMLFNIASYIDDDNISQYDKWKYLFYKLRNYISATYHSNLSQELKDEILGSSNNGWEYGFFNLEAQNYLPTDEKGHYHTKLSNSLSFTSPNQPISQMDEYEIYDMSDSQIDQASKITPSPLGKYYFELSDNKSVYIEFFPRIYPSITNPPKGWSKEMMQKLDLKLE
ncbi:hypothetical protein [Helicobacter sp. T3_23-1056]